MEGYADDQRETIIPCYYPVAGYEKNYSTSSASDKYFLSQECTDQNLSKFIPTGLGKSGYQVNSFLISP